MKKFFAMALAVCCLFFSSCSAIFADDADGERGLEAFHPNYSDFEVNRYIIPEGFIDEFEYLDGNFYHMETSILFALYACDRTLLYFEYDSETYFEAKAYAMENLILSDAPIHEYNGYSFYLNETASKDDHFLGGHFYPHQFLSFSYNDEQNTLVFLGFLVSVELHDEVDAVADDWPAFLEKYYGEWYSFS